MAEGQNLTDQAFDIYSFSNAELDEILVDVDTEIKSVSNVTHIIQYNYQIAITYLPTNNIYFYSKFFHQNFWIFTVILEIFQANFLNKCCQNNNYQPYRMVHTCRSSQTPKAIPVSQLVLH